MTASQTPHTRAAGFVPVDRLDGRAESGRRYDLEQVSQLLPVLLDSVTDALVVVDRERRVVAANRRYLEVFGVRQGQVVGALCDDCVNCPEETLAETPGDEAQACLACEVIESGEPRRVIRTLHAAGGTPRRWEATFNPVIDGGQVTHVVEVWRDISERSRLESQLAHSERLASLGTLAAGVGHEINNPLAAVLAGVESLQRRLARGEFDRDQVSEVLELLERETRRCRETTDKLMLLAQPHQTAPSWVNLNRAVRDTLSLLNYEARKRRVKLVEALQEDLPQVWARESGMRGVCMNLMMNAVQAMAAAGGTLTVATRSEGDRVVLEVADTGPGIEPHHLERIWDPFFTTKPVGQGTGLGLSVTRRVIDRHAGQIEVVSEPGRGARFIVTLPVAGPGGDNV